MIMKKIAIVFVSMFMFVSCASAAKKDGTKVNKSSKTPEWTQNGNSSMFPQSAYITGIGSADDIDSAKDRARGEISKVFSTDIQATSMVSESERTVSSSKGSMTESSSEIGEDLRAVSKKTLEGIEIAEVWQDKNSFRWYALAVLERAKIRRIYRDKLAGVEEQLSIYEKQMDSAETNMDKAMAALKIKPLLKTKSSLEEDLKVIGGSGSFSGLESASALQQKAEAAISALGIYVEVVPANIRIQTEVATTLTSLGMKVSKTSAGADISVRCEAELAPFADPTPGSRWKWYTGEASVSLTDVKAGKDFVSFNVSAKKAEASETQAKASAEKDLGKKIGKGINESIENYSAD